MVKPGSALVLVLGLLISSCVVYKPVQTNGNAMNEVLGHYQIYVHSDKGIAARKLKRIAINQQQFTLATGENTYLNNPSSTYQAYKKRGVSETEVHLYGSITDPGNFRLNEVNRMLIFSPTRKILLNQSSLQQLQRRVRFFIKQDQQLIPVNNLELSNGKLNFYAYQPLVNYRSGSFGSGQPLSPKGADVFLSLDNNTKITQFDNEVEVPLERIMAVDYNQVNVDKTFTNTALALTLFNVVLFSTLFATKAITSSY